MLRFEATQITNGEFVLSANLDVRTGARIAVIGPSGSGKSTLLEALAGFRDLSHGRILWNDQDIAALPPGKRPVAMLFQDGNLFPHMSAVENVALGLDPNGRITAALKAEAMAALDRVGLSDMDARKPAELSGGQQSRVALARVLVQRREILLLDEPFAALGPALKADMLDLVADLVAETGATLMMVSHDPEDARRICDQAILVAENTALHPQDTGALLDNPPPALRRYLGG